MDFLKKEQELKERILKKYILKELKVSSIYLLLTVPTSFILGFFLWQFGWIPAMIGIFANTFMIRKLYLTPRTDYIQEQFHKECAKELVKLAEEELEYMNHGMEQGQTDRNSNV